MPKQQEVERGCEGSSSANPTSSRLRDSAATSSPAHSTQRPRDSALQSSGPPVTSSQKRKPSLERLKTEAWQLFLSRSWAAQAAWGPEPSFPRSPRGSYGQAQGCQQGGDAPPGAVLLTLGFNKNRLGKELGFCSPLKSVYTAISRCYVVPHPPLWSQTGIACSDCKLTYFG